MTIPYRLPLMMSFIEGVVGWTAPVPAPALPFAG